MWWRAFLIWFLLLFLAVLNGLGRERWLEPQFGEKRARQLSCLTGCAAFLLASWFTLPWIGVPNGAAAWQIGFFWLILTLFFEFGFGRARGMSWSDLLADYAFWRGRLWILVLIVTVCAPYLAWHWHH